QAPWKATRPDMKPCPDLSELRNFLDDALSAAARARAQRHIEECPDCRRTLDRLLISDGWPGRSEAMSAADFPVNEPPARGCDLEQTPPSCPTTWQVHGQTTPPREIIFPCPPTAEAPLGQLGAFDILAHVGAGSYGVVFRARDRKLSRIVALKIVRPELAGVTEVRKSFQQARV